MVTELRLSIGYFIIAVIWIVFSDSILHDLFSFNTSFLILAQTYKGLLFVSLTAIILYLTLRREFAKRRQIYKSLSEREDDFRYLFMHNPLPMWVYDLETLAFLDVNATAVEHYGYSRQEFLSMRITDIRPEEEVPRLLEDISSGRPVLQASGVWKHRLKNKSIIDVEITSHRLDFTGRKAILVVAHNVTKRIRMEAELREKEQLHLALEKENELRQIRSSFISSVSHEFRTPLTVISTAIALLERYYERMNPEKRHEHFRTIEREISRLLEMVTDILTMMRSEAVGPEYNTEMIDLHMLCREIYKEIKSGMRPDLKVSLNIDCSETRIRADEKLLRYAIGNLLSNAVKYSRDAGNVWFTLECESDRMVIRVKDEGIGIPEESLPRLFEPFYRAKNAKDISGTGLGLAIAKQAVELHGGMLNVDSTVGQGSEFTILLPRTL